MDVILPLLAAVMAVSELFAEPVCEADTVLRERTPRRRCTEARSEERRVHILADGFETGGRVGREELP
jgi:hypothetical protein